MKYLARSYSYDVYDVTNSLFFTLVQDPVIFLRTTLIIFLLPLTFLSCNLWFFSAPLPKKLKKIQFSFFEYPTTWSERQSLHHMSIIWPSLPPSSVILPHQLSFTTSHWSVCPAVSVHWSAFARASTPLLNPCRLLAMFLPPSILLPTYK